MAPKKERTCDQCKLKKPAGGYQSEGAFHHPQRICMECERAHGVASPIGTEPKKKEKIMKGRCSVCSMRKTANQYPTMGEFSKHKRICTLCHALPRMQESTIPSSGLGLPTASKSRGGPGSPLTEGYWNQLLKTIVQEKRPGQKELHQVERTRIMLKEELRGMGVVEVYVFGSRANGMMTTESDIDFYLEVPGSDKWEEGQKLKFLKGAKDKLGSSGKSGMNQHNLAVVPAKVPIVTKGEDDRGRENPFPFEFDLSVTRGGVEKTTFFRHIFVKNPKAFFLSLVMIQWAKDNGLHGGSSGLLNSYTIATMCANEMGLSPLDASDFTSTPTTNPFATAEAYRSFYPDLTHGKEISDMARKFLQYWARRFTSGNFQARCLVTTEALTVVHEDRQKLLLQKFLEWSKVK